MRSSTDPLEFARRGLRSTLIVGTLAVGGAAAWSFWPLPARDDFAQGDAAVEADAPAQEPVPAVDRFDVEAFALELWNSKPREVENKALAADANTTRAAPAPPLKLELVCVTLQADGMRAAIYDPVEDRLWILKEGDKVDQSTLSRIALDAVEFTTGSRRDRLLIEAKDR